jgi:predicted AlkP superfamily phosphohydrolase/phosphomutase
LEGREPAGLVTGAGYEPLRAELIGLFEELADADTGEPVVERAARFEEVGGGPVHGGMPDVCVQWKRRQRPRAIRSERVGEITIDNPQGRESLHWTNGFLVGAGPGIPATAGGRLVGPQIRLVDFAATVLDLFGLSADELDGAPVWTRTTSGQLA